MHHKFQLLNFRFTHVNGFNLKSIGMNEYEKKNHQFISCRNPTLRECEDETHTPEMGTWESSVTPESSKFDCKGQNTLHWGVLYIIGKLLKCRCPKWACMTHLDICNTSYGQKKGRESNWQFDSWPWEVGKRPDSLVFWWRATCRLKALDEGYNFGLDLVSIGGLHQKL